MRPDISAPFGPNTRYMPGNFRPAQLPGIWAPSAANAEVEASHAPPPPPLPTQWIAISPNDNVGTSHKWVEHRRRRRNAAALQKSENHLYDGLSNSRPDWWHKQHLQLVCRISGCELAFGEPFKDEWDLRIHLDSPTHKKLNAETPKPPMCMAFEHIPTIDICFLEYGSEEKHFVNVRNVPLFEGDDYSIIGLWTRKSRETDEGSKDKSSGEETDGGSFSVNSDEIVNVNDIVLNDISK